MRLTARFRAVAEEVRLLGPIEHNADKAIFKGNSGAHPFDFPPVSPEDVHAAVKAALKFGEWLAPKI